MLKRVEGEQRLDLIAEKVVKQAIEGDDKAYREIGDRLDGKATQQVEATIRDERMVVEAPPVAKDADEWASKHGPH